MGGGLAQQFIEVKFVLRSLAALNNEPELIEDLGVGLGFELGLATEEEDEFERDFSKFNQGQEVVGK